VADFNRNKWPLWSGTAGRIQRNKHKVSVIKEKDEDNRILECVAEGGVQYLISGDRKHLLPLKEYQRTKILSPSEFLKLLFL
jgi:predicted nucleic acid-binding protein